MANNVNVTNRGFEYICQWMSTGSTTNWVRPTYIGWGGANGTNASSVNVPATAPSTTVGTGQWSDIAPYQEFAARVNGTPTVTANTAGAGTITTQVVGTITAGSSLNIGESFLMMNATTAPTWSLSTAMTSGATGITVSTAWGSITGSVPFYLQIQNEVVEVSATASTTTGTIVRAQNGSTAAAWTAGTQIALGNVPGTLYNQNSADMFAHAGFVALALNSGDSIQFTWQVNVTS